MLEKPEAVLTPEQIAEYRASLADGYDVSRSMTHANWTPLANSAAAIEYARRVHPIFQPGFKEDMARRHAELTAKMVALGWPIDDEDVD